MLLLSWNVNGLRAALGRNLPEMYAGLRPDVLCLQETKAWAADVPDMNWAAGCHATWGEAAKKGYAGTLTLCRQAPLNAVCGLGQAGLDGEGRVVTTQFADFYLVNVYTPNVKPDLSRLAERTQVWDPAFLAYLKKLEKKKPVIACGDFNCAHTELDIARPKDNLRSPGFTVEEREQFSRYPAAGFLDSFREFEKGGGHYSWWSQRTGARARNIGWRIDYFLVSKKLRGRLKRAFILPEVLGSDHCPVGIELA